MPAKKQSAISPSQFPALRELLRGYFHEDLEDEYGSPEAAARQFWQDADAGQRKAVKEEWSNLLKGTQQFSLDQINQFLQKIGSAWIFNTRDEIEAIGKVFGS